MLYGITFLRYLKMMDNIIYTKLFDAPPIDRREVLRYAGVPSENAQIAVLLDECISEVDKKLSYKVCYREFPICECDGAIELGFCRVESKALSKNLLGCNKIKKSGTAKFCKLCWRVCLC